MENKLEIGKGVYTMPDLARILDIPVARVNRWIKEYWDGELGREFKKNYSWSVGRNRAVSFHTLIEIYVLIQFAEAGVKTRKVLEAHKELSKFFNTDFPFARKEVLNNLRTDKKEIYIDYDGEVMRLDGKQQFNLDFIKMFFQKLDFNDESIVERFWPMGRDKEIVIDPNRQFGQPVLKNNNIYPETLYNLYLGGDSIEFISEIYELSQKEVTDALEYCKAA